MRHNLYKTAEGGVNMDLQFNAVEIMNATKPEAFLKAVVDAAATLITEKYGDEIKKVLYESTQPYFRREIVDMAASKISDKIAQEKTQEIMAKIDMPALLNATFLKTANIIAGNTKC